MTAGLRADAQIMKERELTVAAINGAMAFGYQNVNPPPEDDPRSDWLKPFWNIGRTQGELLEALRKVVAADLEPTSNERLLRRVRAAIAKATGGAA